jgi:DNA polymerase bacteriophage-type
MTAALHGDFETRGTVDLKKAGIDLYSRHHDTTPWCLGYAIDDQDARLIGAAQFRDPNVIKGLRVQLAVSVFVAHNAHFELAIWNNIMVPRYGWPDLKPEQVRCTMAMAYAMSLPGSLEKAAAAVGIKEQKDLAGHRLMMQMARPREVRADGTIVWWDEPEKVERLGDYCLQDVRVERELDKRLMQLSPGEARVWQLDYAINQRGFYVDRAAINAANAVVAAEADRLNADMRKMTGNFVGFTTENARFKEWLNTRGMDTESVAKAEVLDMLALPDLPADVRTALRIRQEAGKTSMAKLDTIVSALSADGRMRNTLQYHGAGPGRWAGRRIQPHNFPRPKIPQRAIEEILEQLPGIVATKGAAEASAWLDNRYGAPLDVLPWCLRGLICAAPGKDLMGADFSNIEGRGLAWEAGEEWKLDAFRAYDAGTGPDLYLVAAKRIWGRDFNKDSPERQHGKVAELACGFGGGVGAFQQMAKTYLVKVDDTLADTIKTKWREAHPATVRYWYALEDAALNAVQSDAIIATGPEGRKVRYRKSGSFLWCALPSGRVICYPYPQIRTVVTPWGAEKEALTYMAVPTPAQRLKGKILPDPSNRSDWARISTYGGELSQNITEGVCRDLLAEAMVRLDDAGAGIVIHCHDEALIEISEHAPANALPEFEKLFRHTPEWARGLPIAADGWRGKRWQKG